MGDSSDASVQGASNGVVPLRARIDAERAATLAAMQTGGETGGDDAAATESKVDAKATATKADTKPAEPTETDASDESPDEEADEADEKPAIEQKADDADKPDPDTAKRIAQVQKATKREREMMAKQRDELAKARTEVESQRQAFAAERAELEEWKQLKARAKNDPLALYKAAGIGEDDYEHHAKVLYNHRKGAEPKDRDAALRMQREKETVSEVSQLRKELDEHKAELAKREQAAQLEQAWTEHIGGVAKAAQDDKVDAPLLRAQLAKNPRRAHATIRDITMQITQETGELPDAADVIAKYEEIRRQEIEELGIDVAAATGKKPVPAPETKLSGSRTLTPGLRAGTAPGGGAKRSRKDELDETRRMLESGKLD